MSRNRKLFLHNHVYFITFRTESGLPLVSHGYMKMILRGCFARAAELYPVTIGDFIVMGNHIHLMLLVQDPTIVDQFMRHLKTESASAINRLLGRRKRTVWEKGYDSPVLLDLGALVKKVSYIYLNPQKADLVDSIEEYPNLSSFEAFKNGKRTYDVQRIRRHHVPCLPKRCLKKNEIRYYTKLLSKRGKKERRLKLQINPKAIFEALNFEDQTYEEYQASVVSEIRAKEDDYRTSDRRVVGAARLSLQSIFKEYVSQAYGGKKMICIATDIVIRRTFIRAFKGWSELAREASTSWLKGHFVPFPPGFFPPGGRPLAAMLPSEFF